MRIPIILTGAALVLSGCNANQGVNLSSQTVPGASRYLTYIITTRRISLASC